MKREEMEALQASGTLVAVKTGWGSWSRRRRRDKPPTASAAQIIALGVERTYTPEGAWRAHTRSDGVRVRFTGKAVYGDAPKANTEGVVIGADVLAEWEPFREREQARIDASEEAAREREGERERAARAAATLSDMGYETLTMDVHRSRRVTLEVGAAEAIIVALRAAEGG